MKSLSFIFSGLFLVMKIATAGPEYLVSYNSTRVDGLEIFYREAGPRDAPAILLLRGLPSSSRMYQPLSPDRRIFRWTCFTTIKTMSR
jgi:hypothetical protein